MVGANLHKGLLNRARSIKLQTKVNRHYAMMVNKGGTADNMNLLVP